MSTPSSTILFSHPYYQSLRNHSTTLTPPPPSASNPSSSTSTSPEGNLKQTSPSTLQFQTNPRLLIGFTCKVCSTRSHKLMSKKAYEKGVVIITCDGCQSKHLIADHLGWFDTGKMEGTIEDIMRRKGEEVVKVGYEEVLQKAQELKDQAGEAGDSEVVEKVKVEVEAMVGAIDGLMEWLPKAADHAAFGEDLASTTTEKKE
ncbi:hypothetical protein HDV05_007520 [Chytridiales sp. JEL 0842]|nr:hypothetical protein HDV05_007520 [Chytridiales sp. JEL 0842]